MVDLAEFLTFLAYLGSPINDLRNAAEVRTIQYLYVRSEKEFWRLAVYVAVAIWR